MNKKTAPKEGDSSNGDCLRSRSGSLIYKYDWSIKSPAKNLYSSICTSIELSMFAGGSTFSLYELGTEQKLTDGYIMNKSIQKKKSTLAKIGSILANCS